MQNSNKPVPLSLAAFRAWQHLAEQSFDRTAPVLAGKLVTIAESSLGMCNISSTAGRCARASLWDVLTGRAHEPFHSPHCGPNCGCSSL